MVGKPLIAHWSSAKTKRESKSKLRSLPRVLVRLALARASAKGVVPGPASAGRGRKLRTGDLPSKLVIVRS